MLSKERENSVISPFSVNTVLSILMNGADSETLHDMRRFLEYDNQERNVSELTINEGFKIVLNKYLELAKLPEEDRRQNESHPAKLYISNLLVKDHSFDVKPSYENKTEEYFNAEILSADFANNSVEETKKVNEWVSNATNHKITEIFKSIPSDTSLAILCSIYFKGSWFNSFSEWFTKNLTFYNNGVTPVKTDIMHNFRKNFEYFDSQGLDAQLIQMDYFGEEASRSDLSFVVVLPKRRNGLNELKDRLNAQNLSIALQSLSSKQIEVFLPKFKVETENDLMEDISPKPLFLTEKAQFSRMSSTLRVVTKIKHKVYIDVNEKGTEAAAITAALVVGRKGPRPPVATFRADHPFLYLIRDRSNGMILFIGQINKF